VQGDFRGMLGRDVAINVIGGKEECPDILFNVRDIETKHITSAGHRRQKSRVGKQGDRKRDFMHMYATFYFHTPL